MQLILPKEQQDIDDLKLLSAYLTESLLSELERVKTEVAYQDLVGETRQLNFSVKENFQDAVQICDKMDGLIKIH